MSDELVKRLRYLSRVFRKHDVEELTYDDYLSARLYPDEAADRIETLTAERDRLREALSILLEEYVSDVDPYRVAGFYRDPETEDCVVKARAALKGETE